MKKTAKTAMKINGIDVTGYVAFAFDGCHKIYVLKGWNDVKEFKKLDYELFKVDSGIIQCYLDSCSLRFIDLYDGSKGDDEEYIQVVPQFAKKVVFEGFDTKGIDANGIDYYHLKAYVEDGKYIVENTWKEDMKEEEAEAEAEKA